MLPHVLSHGTCQRPPLLWCVFKKGTVRFRWKKSRPVVCVCFLAVEETTPLRCTEALWAWCEQGGRGMKGRYRWSQTVQWVYPVGPREQERAVCRPQSSPQQISERTWAQFDWFLENEWWMSVARGCLFLCVCINNAGVCVVTPDVLVRIPAELVATYWSDLCSCLSSQYSAL